MFDRLVITPVIEIPRPATTPCSTSRSSAPAAALLADWDHSDPHHRQRLTGQLRQAPLKPSRTPAVGASRCPSHGDRPVRVAAWAGRSRRPTAPDGGRPRTGGEKRRVDPQLDQLPLAQARGSWQLRWLAARKPSLTRLCLSASTSKADEGGPSASDGVAPARGGPPEQHPDPPAGPR